MNILRCIDIDCSDQPCEGSLVDLTYTYSKKEDFKCINIKVYSVINNVVGKEVSINIIEKLVLAKEMLRYLRYETSNEQIDGDDIQW